MPRGTHRQSGVTLARADDSWRVRSSLVLKQALGADVGVGIGFRRGLSLL